MINFSDRGRIADPKSSPTRWRYTGLNRPEGSKNPYRKLISVCLCFSSFINITFTIWSRNLVIGDEFDIVDILVVVFTFSFPFLLIPVTLGCGKMCDDRLWSHRVYSFALHAGPPFFIPEKSKVLAFTAVFFETLFIWFFQDDIMSCHLYKR